MSPLRRSARLVLVAAAVETVAGLVSYVILAFLLSYPPTVDFTAAHRPGQDVHLELQTVGAIGFGPHPDWVSYMTRAPGGRWVHTTLWDLPAHTRIDVTIDQFDTGSPLRNQELGQVYGVAPGSTLNGKPYRLVNSNDTDGVGHTFSIPTLGISVPLPGIDPNAKSQCSEAPCASSFAHNVIRFSFTTPGPGQYPWQCFVPCGAGWLYGTGGPMQSIGYMDGLIKVLA